MDPNGTGMVQMIPLDDKVFEEAIEKIFSDDISESLLLKLSNMYYKYFEDPEFEIEIEIINSINISNIDGEIVIDIDNESTEKRKIISFDKLHYEKIPEDDKKQIIWDVYENN